MKTLTTLLFFVGFCFISFAQNIALPLDSVKANPFLRQQNLVGSADAFTIYDKDNGSGQRDLFAHVNYNSVAGNAPSETASFEVSINDQISEPRRIASVVADVNGDGRDEVVFGYSSVFATSRLRVASFSTAPNGCTISDYVSIGPSFVNQGYDQQSYGNQNPSYFAKFELFAEDLDDNGSEEVIAVYFIPGNSMRANIYKWDGSQLVSLTSLVLNISLNINCIGNGELGESWGAAMDDFDYDGIRELALVTVQGTFPSSTVAHLFKIYPDDLGDYTFQETATATIQSGCMRILGLRSADINGDLIPELILATEENNITLHCIQVGDNADTEGVDYLGFIKNIPYSWTYSHFYNPDNYIGMFSFFGNVTPDIVRNYNFQVGDINRDGMDDMVVSVAGNYKIILGKPYFSDINASLFPYAFNGSLVSNLEIPAPSIQEAFRLVDMNLDGYPEFVLGYNIATSMDEQTTMLKYFQYSASSLEEIQSQDVVVSSIDGSNTFTTATSFSICAGDFTGDGYTLGKPRQYELNDVKTPLVILGAPPVHSDDVGGEFINVTSCDFAACDKISTYSKSINSTYVVQTEINSDWAIGASVGADVNVGVVNVNAKVEAKYGQGFSNLSSASQSFTQNESVNTAFDDYILVSNVSYDVREYPIIKDGQVVSHMLSMRPTNASTDPTWNYSKGGEHMLLYLPKHEVGNVLSYPSSEYISQVIPTNPGGFATPSTIEVGSSSGANWTLSFVSESTTQATTSSQVSLGASLDVSAFGAAVGISGEYSSNTLNTHTTTVNTGIECSISYPPVAPVASANFRIKPYIVWTESGSLKLDYFIDPSEPLPGSQNYWSANYTTQDPAWNLPYRLDEERQGAEISSSDKRLCKSIWMTNYRDGKQVVYPQPGDTITVHARVFNYSISDTDGEVPVSFYIGHPMQNGLLLTSLGDSTVVNTQGSIPHQFYKEVKMTFIMPSDDLAPDARLYGVIDPENTMEEVHEVNNYGWVDLGTAYTMVEETVQVEEVQSTLLDLVSMGPIPTHDMLNIRVKASESLQFTMYDLTGRKTLHRNLAPNSLTTLDVSTLSPGLYTAVVRNAKGSYTQKIVIE